MRGLVAGQEIPNGNGDVRVAWVIAFVVCISLALMSPFL